MSRACGFGALAWRPALVPVVPSASASFAPELVAKGRTRAGGGYCAACHTRNGGERFAGGYGMETPFGVIYSTNITPDPETGIGTWSKAAFARAMQKGVSRDSSHLLPVFYYDHFAKFSDDDVHTLYAYFMTRTPVYATRQPNGIPFPFNIRYLQVGWKLLFSGSGASNRMSPGVRSGIAALPRAGLEPLRRLPYAAQPAGSGEAKQRLRRRGDRQLGRAAADGRKSHDSTPFLRHQPNASAYRGVGMRV
nr:c-type cytochrome [Bradyrhizobium tropiciagri]